MENRPKNLAAKAAMLGVGMVLAFAAYAVSIGPVYYCWAAFSANMTTHSKIERFYAPLFAVAPVAVDYRDVSRIAGHQLTNRPLQ